MATNPYFNHLKSRPEQELYEALVVENIKNAGVDVYYVPREYFQIDPILGEPVKSMFNAAYRIEVYFKDVMGFQGQGDLMTKFGLTIQDDTRLEISKRRFRELNIPDRRRPREGDLLYIGDIENAGYDSFVNSFFEITHVEHDSPFWQVGKRFTYELQCQLFAFNYEQFNSGNEAVDKITEITNESEIDKAINVALDAQEQVLKDFTEQNPFGDF